MQPRTDTSGHTSAPRKCLAPPRYRWRQQQGFLSEMLASPWPWRHRGACAGQAGSEAPALLQVWFAGEDAHRPHTVAGGAGRSTCLRSCGRRNTEMRPESSLDPQVTTPDSEVRVNGWRSVSRDAPPSFPLPRERLPGTPHRVYPRLLRTEAGFLPVALLGVGSLGACVRPRRCGHFPVSVSPGWIPRGGRPAAN